MSKYCDIHSSARIKMEGRDNAIEYIYVKPQKQNEIRFVFYSPVPNTMYVTENEWLELYESAINQSVFPGEFLEFLGTIDKIEKDTTINKHKGTKEYEILARGELVDGEIMSSIDLVESEKGKQFRFVYHKRNENGKFKNVTRPLDLPVYEMMDLFEDAVKNNVFSDELVKEMSVAAKIQLGFEYAEYDKDDCLDRVHPNKLK